MNSDKYGDGPDPYTYPNSQVLINKFGITDDDQFIEMEKDFSELAIMEIEFSPPPYDLRYWCALHQALFGDIYHWAGELRTIDISKGTTRFCNINRITPEANRLFNQLAQENYLVGLPYDSLILMLSTLSVKVMAGRSGCCSNTLLSIAAFKSPLLASAPMNGFRPILMVTIAVINA